MGVQVVGEELRRGQLGVGLALSELSVVDLGAAA